MLNKKQGRKEGGKGKGKVPLLRNSQEPKDAPSLFIFHWAIIIYSIYILYIFIYSILS